MLNLKRRSFIMLELPPPLPDDVLARRQTIPLKPAPVELHGKRFTLKPLDIARDLPLLYPIANGSPITIGDRTYPAYDADEMIWRYMSDGPFNTPDEMGGYFQRQLDAPNGAPFVVYDRTINHPVGELNYMSNDPNFLKVEIGGVWYSPIAQRTGANLEATYLLVKHAFELGYRRVEWKCHTHNERSRRSALRMGFKFEGIQEQHQIIKGRNRDTAWFRILDHEWDTVRQQLEQMIEP
jgi:RimJ/RimL family protein N-acetyltransferase